MIKLMVTITLVFVFMVIPAMADNDALEDYRKFCKGLSSMAGLAMSLRQAEVPQFKVHDLFEKTAPEGVTKEMAYHIFLMVVEAYWEPLYKDLDDKKTASNLFRDKTYLDCYNALRKEADR